MNPSPGQPALVGRDKELDALKQHLADAMAGKGTTVMISGEPGIGKTALVEAFKEYAATQGVKILSGAASADSARPFLVFSKALSGEMDAPLFEEQEYTSFVKIFAINQAGMLMAQASSDEGDMDADIFAGMLSAVQNFISDSLGQGMGEKAGLGRLEYGDMKILIEHGQYLFLTAVVRGGEHPDMKVSIQRTLQKLEEKHQAILKNWNGNMAELAPVNEEIAKLTRARFLVRRDIEGLKLENERLRIADKMLDSLTNISAGKPWVLLLEDMHWADESSLFAFNYLARNIADKQALIIGTYRPKESETLDSTLAKMRKEVKLSELALNKLEEQHIHGMINSVCPNNDFSRDFISTLAGRCGGTPLFIIEFLKQMAADGSIADRDGKYTIVNENICIPDSVEGVIQNRLAGLSSEALAMAEYSSCIGMEVGMDAAKSIRTIDNPDSAISELQKAGVMITHNGNAEFGHAIYQEIIYSAISPRWKSIHHRSIGEFFENSDNPEERLYELATHFSRTAEHGKAYRYCVRAGEKAEASFAAEQALRFYRNALSALKHLNKSPGTDESEVLARTGNLYELTGELDAAIAAFARIAEISDDTVQKAMAHRRMGEIFDIMGNAERATEELDKALALVNEPSSPEMARIYIACGVVHQHKGDNETARKMYRDAIGILEAGGNRRDIGEALYKLAICGYYQGAYDEAMELLEKAHGYCEEAGNLRGKANALNAMGAILKRRGDTQKALERYRESLAIKEKLGEALGIAQMYNNLGNIFFDQGDLATAGQHYEMMLAIYRKAGNRRGIGDALNLLGSIAAESGENDRALGLFKESLAIQESIGDPRTIGITLGNIGMLNVILGRYEEAVADQKRRIELCEKISDKWGLMRANGQLGEALTMLGHYDEAERKILYAVSIARDVKIIEFEGMALRMLGVVETKRGNWAKAAEAFESSLVLLRQEDNQSDLAEALHDYGKMLKLTGNRALAKSHLSEAMKIYVGLGRKFKIDDVKKEMDSL